MPPPEGSRNGKAGGLTSRGSGGCCDDDAATTARGRTSPSRRIPTCSCRSGTDSAWAARALSRCDDGRASLARLAATASDCRSLRGDPNVLAFESKPIRRVRALGASHRDHAPNRPEPLVVLLDDRRRLPVHRLRAARLRLLLRLHRCLLSEIDCLSQVCRREAGGQGQSRL